MPLTLGFFVLAALALLGLVVDVPALRRVGTLSRLAIASVVLKALVALGFAGWWLAFNVLGVRGNGWSDLATFVTLLLLSLPLLSIAVVLDVLIARKRRHAAV